MAALCSAAGLSFACSKENPGGSQSTIQLTVNPEIQPLNGEAAKTYIDADNNVLWGGGEKMVLGISEDSGLTELIESEAVDGDGASKISFSFDLSSGLLGRGTVISGIYPSSCATAEGGSFKVTLPGAQNATATSYDPAAYLLVAKPCSLDETAQGGSYVWNAAFRRAAALNKLTLKGIDEPVSSVKISTPGISLAGSRSIDPLTGDSGEISDGIQSVSVSYSSPLPAADEIDIWFTSWKADIPEGGTLTVEVTTSGSTLTRSISAGASGIHFYEGQLNTLGIDMSGSGKPVGEQPGWLELPKYNGDEEYLGSLYAGDKRNYSYFYDPDWYSSMWTAYPLYSDAMGSEKRPGSWSWNPQVPAELQIDVRDHSYGANYSGTINNTIYSRGHQIPNGDRNGNSEMQRQTFYVTNSTPQIQDYFNGGIWQKLEQALQDEANSSSADTLYIATGPVFQIQGQE